MIDDALHERDDKEGMKLTGFRDFNFSTHLSWLLFVLSRSKRLCNKPQRTFGIGYCNTTLQDAASAVGMISRKSLDFHSTAAW